MATPGEANGTNRRHRHSILLHSNQPGNTTDRLANLRPTRSARASQPASAEYAAYVTKAQTVICLLCSRTQTTVPDCLGHAAKCYLESISNSYSDSMTPSSTFRRPSYIVNNVPGVSHSCGACSTKNWIFTLSLREKVCPLVVSMFRLHEQSGNSECPSIQAGAL